jgi:hypothetical protein
VRYQGNIEVGAGIFGASVLLLVGHHDPLCSSEFLLQEMGVALLLLPCFGGGVFARASLVEGLDHISHNGHGG